jgi:hypothetical protein
MHEVHAEATRFLYFAPDDPTDGAEYGGSRVKPLAPDLAGYYRGKDRRLVIFENPVNRQRSTDSARDPCLMESPRSPRCMQLDVAAHTYPY